MTPSKGVWLVAKPELKLLREQAGYRQSDMVDLLNSISTRKRSRIYYTLIEQGKRKINAQVCFEIAKILGTTIDKLFQKKELIDDESTES